MSDKNTIKEVVNGFTRILRMEPAVDKRNSNPSKDYGIHGVNMRFELLKDNKAVHFVIFTNMQLPHIYKEWQKNIGINEDIALFFKPMGAEVGYHSPKPLFKGQRSNKCHLLIGGKCYSDGSGLRADLWVDIWLEKGNDEIWKMLEKEWKDTFENEK